MTSPRPNPRRRFLVLVYAVLWCGKISAAGAEPPFDGRARAQASLRAGERALLELHDVGAAERLFVSAHDQDPTFGAPIFNLGVLAESQERWGDALKWFKSFVAVDATSSWSTRAQVEIQRCKAAERNDATDEGLRQRRYRTAVELGRRLLDAQDVTGALAEANRANTLLPSGWEAHALAAAAFSKKRQFEEASSHLTAAINAHDSPELRRALAFATEALRIHPQVRDLTQPVLRQALTTALDEAQKGITPKESFPGIRGRLDPQGHDAWSIVNFSSSIKPTSLRIDSQGSFAKLTFELGVSTAPPDEAVVAVGRCLSVLLPGWSSNQSSDGTHPVIWFESAAGRPIIVSIQRSQIGMRLDVTRR